MSAVEQAGVRWPHAWYLCLALGAVLVPAHRLLPPGLPSDLGYVAVGMVGVAAGLLGIRLRRPAEAAAWYALVGTQVLWVIGDLVGAVLLAAGETEAFPTAADVFYLAGYPSLVLCLFLLVRSRRPRRDVEGLLDGLTVGVGLTLLCWLLLARPTAARYDESQLAATVAAAYPLLDVVVIGMLVGLLTTPGVRTGALRLLVIALGLVIIADTSATALDLLPLGSTTDIDFLWLASYMVVGAALLHPSLPLLSGRPPADAAALSTSRLVASLVAVLVPSAALVTQHLLGVPVDVWGIALASAAMFVLVVARMNVVIRQVVAANLHRERAQQQLAHQAAHDSLTDLPNRGRVMELLGQALARASRTGTTVAVLYVDLDGFKAVNDSYGHAAGDEVLREVGGRMQRAVREGDVVARLGGDEFLVLLEPLASEEGAVALGRRLVAEVATPVTLAGGAQVRVGASVGVAVGQQGRSRPETLLVEADAAAYRAKRLGRGRVEVFDQALRHELEARTELEHELRAALAQDQPVLLYQPVVDLSQDRVRGYEALAHWRRPGRGLVPLAELRTLAEQSDLVFELDRWTLDHATAQLAAWDELSGPRLRVGVSVSSRHLARARLLDDVQQALAAAGLSPHRLLLQVSDTELTDDPVLLAHLERLRELGVAVCLDDFGAGHSSVRRLEHLPIDLVKLDGSFLTRRNGPGEGLFRLLVQGVQNFKLPLVIKGVDRPEDLALARSVGADRVQGRQLGEPLTAAEVAARLAAEARLAVAG